MTHPGVEEVAEHLEGVLPPDDDRRVREHLARCTDCSATAAALGRTSARLREAAAQAEHIPPAVEARVRDALAAESRRRADDGGVPAGPPVRESEVYAGSGVTPLDRRRRRRRALGGGLLAAAAATVVAVGLGDVLGGGVSGGSAGQAESALADRGAARADGGDGLPSAAPPAAPPAAGGAGEAPDRPVLPPASALSGDPGGGQPRARLESATPPVARHVALVQSVARRHRPGSASAERADCVRAVLAQDAVRTASYAVALPRDGGPGAVVLRPRAAPTEGLLLDCGARPRLLLRHALGR